jgi:GT2 family glycosyltransferase
MRISVVIPCRNEAKHIDECVRAVYSCELPKDALLNVHAVDGLSDDGTRDILENLMKEFGTLYLIDNARRITPVAFNLGIGADKDADYVMKVDARHILSADYIIKAFEILNSSPEIWGVGGRIINVFESEISRLISLAMSTPFGMGLGNFRTLQKSGSTDTITSPMYPRGVFERIGLFDEELVRNQDDDFNFRIRKAGAKVWYEHEISLKYYVRSDYSSLMRQFFQYGYWKVYVNRKHRTVTTIRQLVPFLFVVYLFTLLLAPAIGLGFTKIYALPAMLYLVLSAGISLSFSKSANDVLRLMRVFGIQHISYGLGYLRGILDFILLNRKAGDKMKALSR